jgi:hypothetical protein
MKLYRYVFLVLIPALVLVSTPLFAGQISGTIRTTNGPLTNANVTITCGGKSGSGVTDDSGRYSIYVAATGSCTLKVNNASAKVFSSKQPTRHNFELSGTTLQKK